MRRFFYILSPALIVAGIYFFKMYQAPSQVRVLTSRPTPSKSKQLFLGKRKQKTVPVVQAQQVPPVEVCQDLERALSDLDFNQTVEEWKELLRVEDLQACQAPQFKDKLKSVYESCYGEKLSDQDCQANMLFLRSMLRTQNITDSDDPETIADLLIKGFSDKNLDFKKVNHLASKLMDQDPSNQNVQKLWAMTKFLSQPEMAKVSQETIDDIYSKLDPEVLESGEFRSYRLFMESGMDPVRATNMAEEYVADFPDRSESHEILGWSLWQQGRRSEALGQMQEAIRLNPGDDYLRKMYHELQQPNANRGTYAGRMNIGIRLEDLTN